MRRFVNFESDNWYTIEDLKEIIKIMENQNTTDKDEPGEYVIDNSITTIGYSVDEDYDIIITD